MDKKKLGLHWQILIGIATGAGLGAILRAGTVSGAEHVAVYSTLLADLFLQSLKMLVVPLIFCSLVVGIVSIPGGKGIQRLSFLTLGYYVLTSVLAIATGLLMVNIIRPGNGLEYSDLISQADAAAVKLPEAASGHDVVLGLFTRIVPENIFATASDNRLILGVIFFAFLLGIFARKVGSPHGTRVASFIESLQEVILAITHFVISLAPFGVLFAMFSLAANGKLTILDDLGMYALTVVIALLVHGAVVLPLLLTFVGRRSPLRFAKGMSPALLTAFSTASSNATLPLTMQCATERGDVDETTASFSLPLGATLNMDGTALYEVVAVLFISQTMGDLSFAQQIIVAVSALAVSIGAAGIPHAGLVMMVVIFQAVGMPVEAVAILLAVDRILDMCRTTINVWSDSVGSAIVSRLTRAQR